jgi:NAD(P)-dependent dehydrogenase (short-subunit alcohol dehydrogenase family)
MAETSRAVLITGCSSGIGHATAERLVAGGWLVYATARRPESLADLAERGCRTLTLDVTDEGSMRDAVGAVEREEGAIGVLVNNAGYSQSGAIESVPMERVRGSSRPTSSGCCGCASSRFPGCAARVGGGSST